MWGSKFDGVNIYGWQPFLLVLPQENLEILSTLISDVRLNLRLT